MKKLISSLSALALACGAVAANAQTTTLGLSPECLGNGTLIDSNYSWNGGNYRYCELPADIAVDAKIVLAAKAPSGFIQDILWVLPQVVVVGNGQVQGADPATVDKTIIEIEAGANIAGAINNSALVMTRGTNLLAYGSKSDPIVFSSLDDGFSGKGEWGGVVLSDFGLTNECKTADTCEMEGISQGTFFFGGDGNNTSESHLEYVVITEGGSQVAFDTDGDPDPNSNSGDEINGLTLYAVDTQTTLQNIHIHDNLDDGIEFFGGNVAVTDLWLTCHQDDSVDWDFGYQGSITGLQIIQQSGADHAFELASNPDPAKFSTKPVSGATVRNASVRLTGGTSDVPFKLKEGTNGTFENIVLSGYNSSSPVVACGDNSTAGPNVSFTDMAYDCDNSAGVITVSSSSTSGFAGADNSFWNGKGYPGCN